MGELRGGRDESDDGDSSARRFPADASDGAREDQPRREPLSRAEHADLVRQNATATNADQAEVAQEKADQPAADHTDADPGEPDPAGADDGKPGQPEAENKETDQPKADHSAPDDGAAETGVPDEQPPDEQPPDDQAPDDGAPDDATPDDATPDRAEQDQSHADQGEPDQGEPDQPEADPASERLGTDALERFDPRRAGLPEVSHAEAAAYIEEHLADRPWLGPARECSPDVQRVFTALDQGDGHAHIRHDGWVTEEMNECRVRNLEDPAQLDPGKRADHIDGLKTGDELHGCGFIATRIMSPEAFATAVARAVEDPDVRAVLDSSAPFSAPVKLRISDVLGEDGHKFCSGWQLEPVNGSMTKAVSNRTAWVKGDHSVPEPRTRPVETFEGGTVTFTFRPSPLGGHQINTILVNVPNAQLM